MRGRRPRQAPAQVLITSWFGAMESLFRSGPARTRNLSEGCRSVGLQLEGQGSVSSFAKRDPRKQAKRAALAPGGWRPASPGSYPSSISSTWPGGVTLVSSLSAGPGPSSPPDTSAALSRGSELRELLQEHILRSLDFGA